jgi:L-lactate dehydrogenase complex protein LldG
VSSRDALLARLRAQQLEPAPLPALEGEWIRYPDPRGQFRAAVLEAAGNVITVGIGAMLPEVIAELEVVRGGARVCSLSATVAGNMEAPLEPHAFRDVDVTIVDAEFGVAENGAVWIDGGSAPVRAALFLTQHLVVLLPQGELVDNLHQAYKRLGASAGMSGFGCFMSGPSKTADIEQALVVGAHGPRSLTIVEY